MGLLDDYKNLANEMEDNNQFPEDMQYDGLTESDREMYEQVLKNMREDMNKANEEMKKNSSSWGNVCQTVNGSIQNNTFKMNEEMLRSKLATSSNGKMSAVVEPIGFMIEGFRCPICGSLMYEEDGKYFCGNCGYEEQSDKYMKFAFVDSTYTKFPLSEKYNEILSEIFRQANKVTRKK